MVVATADTGDAPTSTASVSGLAIGTYDPASLTATFSNRPGGAPDVLLTYGAQLQAINRFPPGTTNDGVTLLTGSAAFETIAGAMPNFSVFFLDQGYFPGVAVPALPLFAPGDVATTASGFLSGGGGLYTLAGASFTAVPEPAATLGIAAGAGLLAFAVRRR